MTQRKFRAYQEEALEFLKSRPHAGLFIDMGLGKTTVTLHAILDLPKPVLLVGPIRVIETVWRTEALAWPRTKGISFNLIRGTPRERTARLRKPADVYMVNPELLGEVLERGPKFQTLVIDESSQFKNPKTKRFKTLRKHLKRFQHRIILTGTPSPNSLMDLWSQIFLLDMGERLETSFYRFRTRYFFQTDYHGYMFSPKQSAKEKILQSISDIIFRAEAHGNLPPREVIHNTVRVQLPSTAQRVYKDLADESFSQLADQPITAAFAASKLMKLRQVASGAVYDDQNQAHTVHQEKIKAVEEILEETGSPVLLVYQFRHELDLLKAAFPFGREFTSEVVNDWNVGLYRLLFLHPQSGGHGVNLQYGGHTMIIFTSSFSYEQMSQTMARIDRQGQENPVVFHYLVAEGTVDELVMKVLSRKTKDQNEVLQLVKEYARDQTSYR